MSLEAFLQPLRIDSTVLLNLALDLSETYKHLALTSTTQFLPTAINVLPTGSETGRFLAIDFGGSNLRIGFVELLGERSDESENLRRSFDKSWPIDDCFKNENAEDLFRWVGGCVVEVIGNCFEALSLDDADKDSLGPFIPVGIAWSFPMAQASMSEATLMPMGKGFAITSDLNLNKLLLAGYNYHFKHKPHSRMKLPQIKIVAITNDASATLASLAYIAGSMPGKQVSMGLIVGTGTNAAIVMNMKDLHPSKTERMILPANVDAGNGSVVVNTEWTINGAAGPLRKHGLDSQWDDKLSESCEIPGFQPFEYMTGGRYLGELVRLIAIDFFVNYQHANRLDLPHGLQTRNGITTTLLSSTVAPASSMSALASNLEIEIPPPPASSWHWTLENAKSLWTIARHVQARSAQLVAAAVVGALTCAGDLRLGPVHHLDGATSSHFQQSNAEDLIVAYTGGVISQYPGYIESCQDAIDNLLSDLSSNQDRQQIMLQEVQNGGVIGAGVLAGTVWGLSQGV